MIQTLLTVLCGVTLGTAFVPGLHWTAFLSVAFGSVFALKSAYESISQRQLDVNILMILAAVGAIVVGHAEDAAALLFLFSLSGTLEEYAMGKTKDAIGSLIKLRPTTATLVGEAGDLEVPVADLLVGQTIRVASFDRFPVDGAISSGQTSVDESAFTGESLPVAKQPGDLVVSGSQNLEGGVLVTVSRVAGSGTLDQVVALVQEAQENKATGEKLSRWFGQTYTIGVLVVFGLSWAIRSMVGPHPETAFYDSLILLVGLSPCALVISTPAATLSALANAAKQGILVRGGEFIERAGNITAIALDKTGTLTRGQLELRAIALLTKEGNLEEWSAGTNATPSMTRLIGSLAAVEAHSTHPSARAVVSTAKALEAETNEASNAETVPGMGVVGMVDGHEWLVGNDKLLQSRNVLPADRIKARTSEWQSRGLTTVYVSGPEVQALLGFGDVLREESKSVLNRLRDLGVARLVMLTGDKPATASAMAVGLELDEVRAGLLPGDKTQIIDELGKSYQVMMVGDGVNDAPSLAKASVGVAMGGLGSDVALEAADVVLMQDNLTRIVDLIELGRRTRRIIKANIAISLGMIVLLAIGSFASILPLPLAVLGHEGSTVLVILNGLRLLQK